MELWNENTVKQKQNISDYDAEQLSVTYLDSLPDLLNDLCLHMFY